MDFAQLMDIISEHGFSYILMAYFLVKDWKFNEQIVVLLSEVKEVLVELRTWHAKEEAK